jgi:hypothetical protein
MQRWVPVQGVQAYIRITLCRQVQAQQQQRSCQPGVQRLASLPTVVYCAPLASTMMHSTQATHATTLPRAAHL